MLIHLRVFRLSGQPKRTDLPQLGDQASPVSSNRSRWHRFRLRNALRPSALGGAWWAFKAIGQARRQLRNGPVDRVEVPPPPNVSATAGVGVEAVLNRTRATCLIRAIVRQRWFAARGSMRDVVIGVSRRDGFAAHAWLDGDPRSESEGYVEIARRRCAE